MDGTCALFHQHRVLQKSHFLPKAIYRLLRGEKGPDLHPSIISGTSVWQSSSQAAAYLLCVDCEQRFHANGEDWTLRNCYRAEQGFTLREILFRADPVYAEDNVRVFFAKHQPEVDTSKLVFFAVSVFWRASVGSWMVDSTPVEPLELGAAYKERLRLFLLGLSGFPDDVALRTEIVPEHEPSLTTICFPYGGRMKDYHHYSFTIPGITFDLLLGQRIPSEARRYCTAKSNEGTILYTGRTLHPLLAPAFSNQSVQKKLNDSMAKRRTKELPDQ
jgi:hypothetical protein